jgi:hypothetical protein
VEEIVEKSGLELFIEYKDRRWLGDGSFKPTGLTRREDPGTFDPSKPLPFDLSKPKTEAQVLFEASMAKKKQSYAQGNKTDMRAVKEVINDSSDTPVVVTGHDNTLHIYPRDLSAPPFRTFKWKADTDLLTFIPETKTRAARSADSHIRYSFPDEATKTVMIGDKGKREPGNVALNNNIKTTNFTNSLGVVIFPDPAFWASIKKEKVEIVEIENTGPQISGTNPYKPQNNNQTYSPGLSQGWIVDNPTDSTEANIFFPGTPNQIPLSFLSIRMGIGLQKLMRQETNSMELQL